MICILAVLLLSLFPWGKCIFKPVNYEYKVFGGVTRYGWGCFKGCQGYHNVTTGDVVDEHGVKYDTSGKGKHEQKECIECKEITAAWWKKDHPGITDEVATEDAKDFCGYQQCYWKKGKCVAGSCVVMAEREKCQDSYGHEWKDGTCKRVKGDKCKEGGKTVYEYGPLSNPYLLEKNDILCKDLKSYYRETEYDSSIPGYIGVDPFTDDDVKECKFKCEHPEWYYYAGGPWDYTRHGRKECHLIYGCMYSGGNPNYGQSSCSRLAIWAFVLILVFSILVFIAIIVVVVIIILKVCGKKSTKVSPEAAPASESKSAAEEASRAPPPESGPYVVIKLGKQSLETKKVESAVWGQSIVFTGLGAEDDDVVFELRDNGGAVLGTANVRIPEYVNAKKRASIALKNGEVGIGVLEVDIEIQVQEEPEVKITGVFYVEKFTKV